MTYPFKLPTPLHTIRIKTRNGEEKLCHLDSTILTEGSAHKLEYVMTSPYKEQPDDIVSIEICYNINNE